MDRRNLLNEDDIDSLTSYNDRVNQLRSSVKTLHMVSDEIGKEIDKQNRILDSLADGILKGQNVINKLLMGVDNLFKNTEFSPMTMTFLFTIFVIIFLWIYYKLH